MAEKEYIERGELFDFLKQEIAKCKEELDNSFGDDCYDQAVRSRMTALIGAWRRITNKSAADVVEVVRCKDCILYKPNYLPGLQKNDNYGICTRYKFLVEEYSLRFETEFCSYGERKTDS